MPLPEHEQRQLRQIEQALYRDDPGFTRRMRASDPRVRYGRKLLQVLIGVVISAGLLAAGTATDRVYLEVAGLVIMLLSLVWAVASWWRYMAMDRPRPARRRRVMERVEARWRRRQEGNGGMPRRTRG